MKILSTTKWVKLLLLFVVTSCATKLPKIVMPAEVPWSYGILKFDHFQEVSRIEGLHDSGARINTNVYYRIVDTISFINKIPGVVVSVHAVMQPYKSYVKSFVDRTGLMEHEQIHFDIAEISARKIRKELSETIFLQKNYKYGIQLVCDKYLKERKEMNNQYDSQHRDKYYGHYYWRMKIDSQLDDLKKYADTSVFVMALPL